MPETQQGSSPRYNNPEFVDEVSGIIQGTGLDAEQARQVIEAMVAGGLCILRSVEVDSLDRQATFPDFLLRMADNLRTQSPPAK